MSFLEQARKPLPKAPMLTIVGSAGTGKSTLGAMFPNAIFIQAEDGTAVFEGWDTDKQPTLMPPLARTDTRESIKAQLRELATADHGFKTVVIDTVTALNKLFEAEISERDEVGSVADASGGFHKGYIEVASWHSDIIYCCDVLRKKKGMTVIFLAHQGVEKVKSSPEEASEYTVYALDMNKSSASLYVAESDAVVYIKTESFITGAETDKKGRVTKAGRIMQTGERTLITSGDGRTGYVQAKNRYSMPSELPLNGEENPILKTIKYFQEQ